MRRTPYWLDTAPGAPDRSGTTVDGRFDVAVVGAGLTGLSAAVHLARSGARVSVLEQETVGWGASGRNGGMATTGLAIPLGRAIERYGVERACAMYQTYDDAIDVLEQLVADEQIACDFERSGKLLLAARPAHLDALRRTHDVLGKELGHETSVVTRADLRSEIGSDRYHGALVDPRGAGLHVGRFVRGLAEVAERRGVVIHERAPVQHIERLGGGGHELTTPRGRVRADQVLVATSGYTARPFRWLQVRIAPVGSFIIVTEPLERHVVDELLPHRRVAADSKNLLFYFRITPDDRLLFGGRARFAMSSPQSDDKSGRILQRAMVSVFPQLADTRVDYCWGGLVDMSLDRMVHAGEHDGLFYSVGYSGHGIQMATYMGRQMAETMAGDGSANPWRDLPFRRIPGHFGPPWFLPFAGAYYRVKDMVR